MSLGVKSLFPKPKIKLKVLPISDTNTKVQIIFDADLNAFNGIFSIKDYVIDSTPKRNSNINLETTFNNLIKRTFVPLTRKCLFKSFLVNSSSNFKHLNHLTFSLKKVSLSIFYLLNLHVNRCLEMNLELPDLYSQNFYQQLGNLVTVIGSNNTFSASKNVSQDLLDSAKVFKSLLPNDYKPVNRSSITPFISTIARTILSAVKNHFDTNIDCRFDKYLKIKYGIKDRYQRAHIVRRVLYEKVKESKFDKYLLNNILIKIYSKKEFNGSVIPKNTKPSTNLKFFIHFFRHMQLEFKAQNTKSFSLMPLSSGFIPDYINITTSLIEYMFLLWHNKPRKDYEKLSSLDKWKTLIKFENLPKVNNSYFGNHVSTDGYGASILYYKIPDNFPITYKEFDKLDIEEKIEVLKKYKAELDKKLKEIKKEKEKKAKEDKEEKSDLDVIIDTDSRDINELDEIIDYSDSIHTLIQESNIDDNCKISDFKYYYGNDPGGRYLFTIAVDGDNQGLDLKDIKDDKKTKYIRCSSKEYCYITHRKSYRDFLNNSQTKEIKELTNYSIKTGDYNLYISNLKEYLNRENAILKHYNGKEYRKRKFTAYIHKQKAFHTLGNKILDGKKAEKIVIGWGNGLSSNKNVKGSHLPNKEFKTFIQKSVGIKIIEIDEFKTTKCCSKCGKECKKMKEWIVVEEGKKTRKKKEKEILSENQKAYSHDIYDITRCNNNDCKITWERDKNASRNIRKVLIHKLNSLERPKYLQRIESKIKKKEENLMIHKGKKYALIEPEKAPLILIMIELKKDIDSSKSSKSKPIKPNLKKVRRETPDSLSFPTKKDS